MMRRALCVRMISAIALTLVSGCFASVEQWEKTRKTEIDPINSAIHRHLPGDIKSRDVDTILRNYDLETGEGIVWSTPEDISGGFSEKRLRWNETGTETIRRRYEELVGLFAEIDKAEVRIHRIYWNEPADDGYPTEVRFVVRGTGPGGESRFLEQRALLHIDRRGGEWVVTRETIQSRELLDSANPRFAVATASANLNDVHDLSGSPRFRLIGEMAASSGSAVADFDCDGLEDLALLSTNHVTLYRNAADGSFVAVNDEVGMPATLPISGAGIVFFDAENDGDPDLWISGLLGQRFFLNEGCGQFIDQTEIVGIAPSTWSSMPIVADYDNDGFLDVYVVRMGDHEKAAPSPSWNARNGTPDSLYKNLGDGTFKEVTEEADIAERGWGLAGAWGDYDDDGDQDLYVGNEFGTNALYRNDGDGTFTDVAEEAGVLDRGAAMGITWGDYDGDGRLDLYVSNMYANSRWAMFHPDYPTPLPWYLGWVPRDAVDDVTDELTRGSTLLRNQGDGTFTDVSDQAGIRDGQWGWGAEFLDYDNDGLLDVYAVNGFISGPLLDDV